MDAKRAERAQKEQERRQRLKDEWEAKRKAEQEALQKEIEAIKAKEAKAKSKVELTEKDIKATQARLEKEVAFDFTFGAGTKENFGFGNL